MVLLFYGFMVSWFCGFIVLLFYGFMALWFYGFKDAPCFQEDIDPISNIFKILFDEWSFCFGARFSHNCQKVGFPELHDP